MAEKNHQRIDEISASDSVEEMIQFKIGRCLSWPSGGFLPAG